MQNLVSFLDVAGAKAAAEASGSDYVDIINDEDMDNFISGVSGSSNSAWAAFKTVTAEDLEETLFELQREVAGSAPVRGRNGGRRRGSPPVFPLEFRTDINTYKVTGYSFDRSNQVRAIIAAKRSKTRGDGFSSEEDNSASSEDEDNRRRGGRN
mmetsp:Transcript_5381/g.12151  ORF Transcript_5381/g.12151 Transcript_5381/m.12151 type:complete len:154 (-) Transcript_5381:504-965(-)